MFGKSKPPKNPALSERIHQVTHRDAPAAAASPGHPDRVAERQAIFRQGVVVLPDGQRLRVAVKSLSETGARVEFFDKIELPEEVLLAEPTLKLRRRARVMWQDEGIAGLHFLPD